MSQPPMGRGMAPLPQGSMQRPVHQQMFQQQQAKMMQQHQQQRMQMGRGQPMGRGAPQPPQHPGQMPPRGPPQQMQRAPQQNAQQQGQPPRAPQGQQQAQQQGQTVQNRQQQAQQQAQQRAQQQSQQQAQAQQKAPQQQVQQGQQQTQGKRDVPPVDSLQALMNFVLVNTGRVLTDPTRLAPDTLETTRGTLRSHITGVQQRFHENLDMMEREVQTAQAVLRRDLIALRREKAERAEAARRQALEEASKKKAAAEAEAAKAAAEKAKAEAEEAARKKREEEEEEEAKRKQQDVEMSDAPANPPPVDTASGVETNGIDESANTANSFDFDSIFDEMAGGGDNSADGGDMDFNFDSVVESQQNDDTNNNANDDQINDPVGNSDLLSGLEKSGSSDQNPPTTTNAPASSAGALQTTTTAAGADDFDFGSFGGMDEGVDSYSGEGGSTFDEMFNYADFETGGAGEDNDLDEMFKDLN